MKFIACQFFGFWIYWCQLSFFTSHSMIHRKRKRERSRSRQQLRLRFFKELRNVGYFLNHYIVLCQTI